MKAAVVCEIGEFYELYEYDVAHRWWALSPGDFLPLSNGDTCQLLFAGRPGSNCGPDVRDAVLLFSTREKSNSPKSTGITTPRKQGKKLVGDVEFHVRASDWYTHQHHTDARYNNVILHVVLICDDATPTLRQDEAAIPLCSLYDLHHLDDPNHLDPLPHPHLSSLATLWPCQVVIPLMSDQERARLLRHAGLLRFEQKTHAFVEQLHNAQPHASFTTYDTCLISALAEGLGYGRDRAFFRAAGLRLLGIPNGIPEPLGRAPNPSPLDANRLRILRNLITQWRTHGAWETIREAIMQPPPTTASPSFPVTRRARCIAATADLSAPSPKSPATMDNPTTPNHLRGDGSFVPVGADLSRPSPMYRPCARPWSGSEGDPRSTKPDHIRRDGGGVERRGGPCARPWEGSAETFGSPSDDHFDRLRTIFAELSPSRTDILICNIVLPFATAIALIENNAELAEQARNLYLAYPALPSNSITRAMCKQLQLPHEPQNACQQQGLHYIYAQTCREKHCARCIAGRHPL